MWRRLIRRFSKPHRHRHTYIIICTSVKHYFSIIINNIFVQKPINVLDSINIFFVNNIKDFELTEKLVSKISISSIGEVGVVVVTVVAVVADVVVVSISFSFMSFEVRP